MLFAAAAAVALTGCQPPPSPAQGVLLPAPFSATFPDHDVPFDNVERSRLARATRIVHERYFGDARAYTEHAAQLPADVSLAAQVPALLRALGEGWERDPQFQPPIAGEAVSLVHRASGQRIALLAVPGTGAGALPAPQAVHIMTSTPIFAID